LIDCCLTSNRETVEVTRESA